MLDKLSNFTACTIVNIQDKVNSSSACLIATLSVSGSLAAVRLRLQSLKGAVRLKMTAAPAVVREPKEASAQQHAGRGYAFRQRKAPGALAEPSAGI